MPPEVEPVSEPPALAATVRDGGGRGLTLVHGFAQTGACWGPLGRALDDAHRVVRVDQPGHGGSIAHRHAPMEQGARLLTAASAGTVLVGYSMGARLCLHAAVAQPEAVPALVLIGGTAGIDDAEERAQRRRSDEALADRLEGIGVEAFLAEWLALPMFAGLPEWARFEAERRTNTVAGLAASLRSAGTGAMTPLWDRLGEITVPVLCLTGELDPRYSAFAERIVASTSGPATHRVIAGAGHAAHLERPEATIAAITTFLADLD